MGISKNHSSGVHTQGLRTIRPPMHNVKEFWNREEGLQPSQLFYKLFKLEKQTENFGAYKLELELCSRRMLGWFLVWVLMHNIYAMGWIGEK